jgi:hypothetical protein
MTKMLKQYQVFLLMIIPSIFYQFSVPDAFAYIDPGTGSVIIQMIIGGLVGTGIAVKVFWYRIKSALSPSFKRNNSDEDI